MHIYTHARTHTVSPRTHARTRTHTHTHIHTHTHTHTQQSHIRAIRAMILKKRFLKRERFSRTFKGADRGRMADRNRELVPDNWSLVGERAMTAGLCLERRYSEHSLTD